jgi:cardiolipin synthase
MMSQRLVRFKRKGENRRIATPAGDLILSGPGWSKSHFAQALKADLRNARKVQIMAAYFLPTWKLRRELMRVAQRGCQVQLLLAGRTDVPLSQLASQSLYQRLLRAGIEIYEYTPQVLHAKLIIIDDIVYIGSANLDTRSLQINYELMLRLPNPGLAEESRGIFSESLKHSRRIEPSRWKASRNFWNKLKERWAYFILARVDPYIAQRQLKSLR